MSKKAVVKVFSTETCPWCVRVKQYLEDNNVEFEDVNVAQNYDAAVQMVQKSGQMGVPQLWIDDEVVIGFDQGKIAKLLEI